MILRLRGQRALSEFRLAKLRQWLPAALTVPSSRGENSLHAEFWHFVEVSREITAAEHERLTRILAYGPASPVDAAQGALLLVTPRPGTISPW